MTASLTHQATSLSPLQRAREEILDHILLSGAFLNTLANLLLIWEALQLGAFTVRLGVGLLVLTVNWTLVLRKSWPAGLREAAGLAIILLAAVGSLITAGLTGPAQIILVFAAVYTLLIYGARQGWLITAMATVAVGLTGWWIAGRPDPPPLRFQIEQALVGRTAPADIAIFLTVSILLILSLRHLILTIQETIADGRELVVTLEAEAEALERTVARRVDLLVTGAEINRRLSQELNRQGLVRETLAAILASGQADGAHFFTVGAQRRQLHVFDPEGEGNSPVPLKSAFLGRVASEGRPLLIALPAGDAPETNPWEGEGSRWAAAVPVVLRDSLLGVLAVHGRRELTEDTLFLLTLIANQLAVSLGNARLFDRAHRQTAHQKTLQRLANGLKNAWTTGDVLAAAAGAVAEGLPITGSQAEIGQFFRPG